MDARWFKNAQIEKETRRKQVLSFNTAFEELLKLIREELVKKPSVRDYASPGWQNQQIAVNEYNQAIDDITSLIKHVEI